MFGLVGVSRDITERKQAEQTLRQAHEELLEHQRQLRHQVEAELAKAKDQLVRQARLAAIGQIAASVVHDLRNSLFVMSNATFLLKGCTSADFPQCRQYIDHICQEIDATKRLAANLMEMARVKQPQKEKFDLGQAAREVFDPLQHGRSISFQMEFDRQPFLVAADPFQLRQVLGNLLANAVQATPDGGHVRLRASRGGGVDTIVVEDDGPGISAELRDQLFEPLVSAKPKGTGLGLAICRQIVEEHGGSIELLPGRDVERPSRSACPPQRPGDDRSRRGICRELPTSFVIEPSGAGSRGPGWPLADLGDQHGALGIELDSQPRGVAGPGSPLWKSGPCGRSGRWGNPCAGDLHQHRSGNTPSTWASAASAMGPVKCGMMPT